jgi:hypothetical protein
MFDMIVATATWPSAIVQAALAMLAAGAALGRELVPDEPVLELTQAELGQLRQRKPGSPCLHLAEPDVRPQRGGRGFDPQLRMPPVCCPFSLQKISDSSHGPGARPSSSWLEAAPGQSSWRAKQTLLALTLRR